MPPRKIIAVLLIASGLSWLGACTSSRPWTDNYVDLETALRDLDSDEPEVLRANMDELFSRTESRPQDFILQRFYASYILAQLHARASVEAPFIKEESTTRHRVGGIGQRSVETEGGDRPSIPAHLVATIYHASRARSLYDKAARSGPKQDGVTLVPEELWSFGVDRADTNLQLLITSCYGRLGFREEVAEILAKSPDMVRLESCLAFLESHRIREGIRPWICALVFDYLKTSDELEAYRFGVAAVEGAERFGNGLPLEVVAEIDDWIVNGAGVRFVCPESQTAYLPGQRESPISGIPHIEYIAVER